MLQRVLNLHGCCFHRWEREELEVEVEFLWNLAQVAPRCLEAYELECHSRGLERVNLLEIQPQLLFRHVFALDRGAWMLKNIT